MNKIQPLTEIRHIPKLVQQLPNANLQSLINNPQLIVSFIYQSQEFIDYIELIISKIDDDSAKLSKIRTLISTYQAITQKVATQLKDLNSIYRQYTTLQTIQYQLLLSFNQSYLKTRFTNHVESLNQKSLELIDPSDTDLKFIAKFRQSRQEYHLQKEKLNRWNEERVSGFI